MAINGDEMREPLHLIWTSSQRALDGILMYFDEGRFSLTDYLHCTRNMTPNGDIIRPRANRHPLYFLPQPESIRSHLELLYLSRVLAPVHRNGINYLF